jgi:CheY-like chemotaxis protein
MSEETRTKVFDPFYTTKFAGRGLGLCVVLGVVRAHSGAIKLKSSIGDGTTFEILLPSVHQPTEQRNTTALLASAEQAGSPDEVVLLVEDEQMLRSSVSTLLRKKGFSVIEAANGDEALNAFQRHKDEVKVILLDLTIPGTPSREVMEEARRIRPEAKIILMSAYSREMVSPRDETSRFDSFIRKPFNFADLLQLIRDTVSA